MSFTSYDVFAQLYDAEISTYTDDLLLYREMARRTGGPILELMCGSGRVLLPLAEDGYIITGVDLSHTLLEMAHERVTSSGLDQHVTLMYGDACSIDVPTGEYALAFIALNSFMHLEKPADQLAALRTIRRALRPDGLCILDVFNPNPSHLAAEDNRLILERDYPLEHTHVYKMVASESDMAEQVSYMTILYDRVDDEGQVGRQTVHLAMRWVYRYELQHMLARVGLVVRSVYGSYDLDAYTSDSERLIVVASVG